MSLSSFLFSAIIISFLTNPFTFSQIYKIIESETDHIIIEFNFSNYYSIRDTIFEGRTYQRIIGEDDSYRNPGDPWIPVFKILAGIPFNSPTKFTILDQKQTTLKNKFIIPFPEEDPELVKQDFGKINVEVYSKNEFYPATLVQLDKSYIVRYANVLPILVSPYQFNPVTRELKFYPKIVIRIDFGENQNINLVNLNDPTTEEFLESSTINPQMAKLFTGKITQNDSPSAQNGYWYNPDKNYFKIYVKEKNVYRLTYEELIASGVPLGVNTQTDKLEMFNDGIPVPIEVFDNNQDLIFNVGDYFQFVGYPPTFTPYCKTNIYNLTNVYWFSYESDSTGLNYMKIPAWSDFSRSYYNNLATIHYEKDSLYERLGYALNDQRDFWFWNKATSRLGEASYEFVHYFPTFPLWNTDSAYIRLRVAMQGMSKSSLCNYDHNAYITINNITVGEITWDGQSDIIFDKKFYGSPDSIPIYPGNELHVIVKGDSCTFIDDEIRINWIEFEYWKGNSAFGKYFDFINYDNSGINAYGIFNWPAESDMRVYIPSKGKMKYLPVPAAYQQFTDTMSAKTEYFLVASDYFKSVDSIIADIPSDLRNLSNGADYIIITHNKFAGIADQLASFRESNFPDESIPDPRIIVVDVQQIYDEFSFGLMDPKALQQFVKYAFDNWTLPAPTYVVLLGDMSYDYRALLASSRPNFIPSIPYYAPDYGQAASDNLIVAVAGNDVAPDLAIGRLSMETVEEGNILLNKLFNYPDDVTKPWKENVLLLASGLSLQDELQFGFNDESFYLGNNFVIPQGYHPSYVFRYPSRPEHEPYQGEGPKIREEINKGAVLVNYYGHGGGYQWDLVFTNEDIYLLENEGRLPLILSVTCYTAHFDNQDVFGEQFNKVPGKGSIGFYGSSGLTYWTIGKSINRFLFRDIFIYRNFIVGKAIMNSKNAISSVGLNGTQINLLTYLGDPVLKLALPKYPDFEITSNNISLSPEDPILGDTIQVKVDISNWGCSFPDDSVLVELYAEQADTSYEIGRIKKSNFYEDASVFFTWIPDKGGSFYLTAKVNESEMIMEDDHSDNIGRAQFIIFNIDEPSILTPIDGFVSSSDQIDFDIVDIGYYISKDLRYSIQVDTSINFGSPQFDSGELIPYKSHVKWTSPNIQSGVYFWRTRIFDGQDYGNWSPTRSFTIMNQNKEGYFAHDKILTMFDTYNVNYSENLKSLILNVDSLPAKPSSKTLLNSFLPEPQLPDTLMLTTITTDGTYIYFANINFYANIYSDGMSSIYRVGTGYNGTIEGQLYGRFSNYRDTTLNSIVCFSDGNLYVAIGDPYKLVRINIQNEIIDTINVPPGIIRDNARIAHGPQYLSTDGKYIYNLAYVDTSNEHKYTVRVFDPVNGWSLVRPDVVLSGPSYEVLTDFLIHGEGIYTCDYYNNYMRKHNVISGVYEDEWLISEPHPQNFQSYYAWCNDWVHDKIFASTFRDQVPEIVPKFGKFSGYHVDANGTINTQTIGPVAWWNQLKYDFINPSPSGEYTTILLGQNSSTKIWDTLQVNIPDSISLGNLDANVYPYLKLKFDLTDSTFQTTEPMELKSVQLDYQPLNDVYLEREDFNLHQDSLLQGYPITFDFKARNFGELPADSVNLGFYLNGMDSLIFKPNVSVPPDSSSISVEYTLDTKRLIFENKLTVSGENNKREYFYFNNLIDKTFFVARDSTRPIFSVKFDDQEIINNDIVSSTPTIVITLEDNSPLPLDTTYFTIVHNNKPLRFYQPDISWSYQGTGTPFFITWEPELEDGRHTLEILAKDASGNFFDSTSYRVIFYVYSENDISEFYNYPNPFSSSTYFTFILKGQDKPSDLQIKIFTIAGRLIRDIKLNQDQLITNFNKIYWDGNDEDGDPIGNGVYIYKVIATFPDQTKTITQKLAKVR